MTDILEATMNYRHQRSVFSRTHPFAQLVLSVLIVAIYMASGCKDNSSSSQNDTPTPANVSTKNVYPTSSAQLVVVNKAGDSIYLSIPRASLAETIAVKLTARDSIAPGPFSRQIFPGVTITPDGLRLLKPALLRVVLSSATLDTSRAILYSLLQSDLACPLKITTRAESTLEGELLHFSDYGGAEPTSEEASDQGYTITNGGSFDLWDWQGFCSYIQGMLSYVEMLQQLGMIDEAQQVSDNINERVKEQLSSFLDLPIPEDPCGYYQQTLFKYVEMFNSVTTDETIEARYTERITEVRARCFIRGELEYNHNFTSNSDAGSVHTVITGYVPFYLNTNVEPMGSLVGEGSEVTWIQTGDFPGGCTMVSTGPVAVKLEGEISIDQTGIAWLEVVSTETSSGTITVTCPDVEEPATVPAPTITATYNTRYLMEDGYTMVMPFLQGTGSYTWTLHLTEQPLWIARRR
jgi:hypothetical protein